MVDIPEALQHKLGPLEAWQWGALAGGAILVYRVVATKGHQTTSVGTVTLTPNNQPDLSGSGNDTVGSVLSGFAATGLFPDEFSITLPNGTVVTFKGGRIVSTTSPGDTTTPPASDPPPPLGAISAPLLQVPVSRGGPVGSYRPGAVLPSVRPVGRRGTVIPGATPLASPALNGPANVIISPRTPPPSTGGTGGSGGPGTSPGARGTGTGGTGTGGSGGPATTPGGHR
jgi:hypothetical protein